MSDYLIVVANSSEARFFTLEPAEFPELESQPRLKAHAELENPEIREAQGLYADSKTGRGTAPKGGSVHGYDDKRDQNLDELRRRFASRIIKDTQKSAKNVNAHKVILASSARMRRFLYPDLEKLNKHGYSVHKIPKNMIKFSNQKIHEYLAKDGLVPRQKKLS